MKRLAAFLLAAVHGIDAVAIDCSHRTRRICRPDRECVAGARASRPRHHSPRRVAVLLRGVAFRNWGSRGTEGSCCNGTETQQRAVVESLDERLFAPLEARGFEVSVYLSTYRCSNGKDWVERDLLPRLAPRLRGLYIGDEANTTQTQDVCTCARARRRRGVVARGPVDRGAAGRARVRTRIYPAARHGARRRGKQPAHARLATSSTRHLRQESNVAFPHRS